MKARRNERGYALLTVMFLAAVMLLVTMTASLNVMTQGKREREKELQFRGNQYVRAIRLYYRKNGKFPQKLEDLSKQDPGQPRFLRQAYKDPMNKTDGSWRFIYVMPTGQLLGSVMNSTIQGMAGVGPGTNMFGAAGPAQAAAASQNAGQAPGTQGAAGAAGNTTTPGTTSSASDAGNSTNGQPPEYDADNPIIGGNIIGVASKIKQQSLMVYNKGTTYYEWEFIWNPLQSTAGAPAGAPGQTPANGQPGTPGSPQLNNPPGPGAMPPPPPSPQIDHN